MIRGQGITILMQPIVDFARRQPTGFECLSRFSVEPRRSPDQWFNEAGSVGLGAALELAAIRSALALGHALPDPTYLSVNASAEVLMDPEFDEAIAGFPRERLVIELTEHAAVQEYQTLSRRLAPLRASGIKLAIDDAGAGFAGLQHIVHLKPDIIKLDMSLTRDIDSDQARRALASALVFYARETGCVIVAEGVETELELETLKILGIPRGQGYLLGRPMPPRRGGGPRQEPTGRLTRSAGGLFILPASHPVATKAFSLTSPAVRLTQELIRFPTISPPGQEQAVTDHLARLLTSHGFACETVDLAPGRPNLIARLGGSADKPPLAFTGHTDVVPLGARDWSVPPFEAMIRDGRVWGRGASDMKAGVAAFVIAAIDMAPRLSGTPGVTLLITAGEETGSEGAIAMARSERLSPAGALVVAEPTSNRPLLGHKGALWLTATTAGVTAHGSMPDKGVNAVYKAARMTAALEGLRLQCEAPRPHGRPDAERRLPARRHQTSIPCRTGPRSASTAERSRGCGTPCCGSNSRASSAPMPQSRPRSISSRSNTPADDRWMASVHARCQALTGVKPAIETAPYFTDASVLTPALGHLPTVILGPGEGGDGAPDGRVLRRSRGSTRPWRFTGS